NTDSTDALEAILGWLRNFTDALHPVQASVKFSLGPGKPQDRLWNLCFVKRQTTHGLGGAPASRLGPESSLATATWPWLPASALTMTKAATSLPSGPMAHCWKSPSSRPEVHVTPVWQGG